MKIFHNKKYCILDLDGTLYEGGKIFPYTRKFLEKLRNSGRQPIFLTNNSSKSTHEYFYKLKKLGIAESENEIYTSARATIEYLMFHGIKKIFLMATPSVEREFTEAGFQLAKAHTEMGVLDESTKNKNSSLKPRSSTKSLHVQTLQKDHASKIQAVVLAFDQTFTYQKFCQAYDLITAGVPFYATHPDLLLPIENHKFHPDIGTLIAAFYTATRKKPFVIGKPEKHIYKQLRARLGCKKEEMVMIGDRLYTDIKGANDYGIDSILVLSGETSKKMLNKKSPKPTFIVENVGALVGKF